ncbi:putative glutathione S-transferase [Synechococcus sp. PCC 7502]|uniref:glutathione S-transferase family protein n=1 Tax=Synechococcus sp. PCC 7502 TaxID=1173263 RepID=UPI00029FB892|nr:glutathione S-transferase C-terminal domain-containing protein [Synechococcus sp. PCC 7502]AFY75421.1 putative glutathione S-transferase [Synechococcus sp. PCC 7502]
MALPPKILIKSAKFIWTSMWKVMMSNLAARDHSGAYIRPESQFRNFISTDPSHSYQPEAGRYALVVGYGCPWAHRTLIIRSLKGLQDAISVIIATPSPDAGIWELEENSENCGNLPQLYQKAQAGYTGRSTVPVLWDHQTKTIVNNESSEIIVMLNSEFNHFAKYPHLDLFPEDLKEAIADWNQRIYHSVNNGVYRCGFAQTQTAYDLACTELFATLDELELALEHSRYLCGDRLTLADIRLFTTLFRFDVVYYSLFKCDRRRIQDYPNLGSYLRDIYQLNGVADTCKLEQVQQDYFGNLFPLNPGGIIPSTPDVTNLLKSHNRERIGASPE